MKKTYPYILLISTLISFMLLIYMICYVVPSDYNQGVIQRIFYFHVPVAWVSFLGFSLTFYYSIRFLKSRDLKYDRKAASHTLVGWVFTTGVIITGPLWAKPIWGDFWNWSDQRLVSFFILWMAYAAYLLIRIGISDEKTRARFSAVLGILAFADVPLVYFAIRLWNTPSHPAAVIAGKSGSGLFDPSMKITFWLGVFCFHLLYMLMYHLVKTNSDIEKQVNLIETI